MALQAATHLFSQILYNNAGYILKFRYFCCVYYP